ncbi:MAG: zinc-ribbon domain-containing protein, partial [Dyadobacter sp.]
MKLFKCSSCGHAVYFENIYCQHCHSSLGFETQELKLYALKPENNKSFRLINQNGNQSSYKYCKNHSHNVCN